MIGAKLDLNFRAAVFERAVGLFGAICLIVLLSDRLLLPIIGDPANGRMWRALVVKLVIDSSAFLIVPLAGFLMVRSFFKPKTVWESAMIYGLFGLETVLLFACFAQSIGGHRF